MEHRRVWHGGGAVGSNSWFNMYVDDGVAMVVTTNITSGRHGSVAADIMMAFIHLKMHRSMAMERSSWMTRSAG